MLYGIALADGKVADQPWIGAFGNGGRRLIVIPSLELVVVSYAGNDNRP